MAADWIQDPFPLQPALHFRYTAGDFRIRRTCTVPQEGTMADQFTDLVARGLTRPLRAAQAAVFVMALGVASSTQASDRARSVRQVTGPVEPLQQAVAAGATTIIRLVPVARHPGGFYAHDMAYVENDIDGNELTTTAGGFRSFWNLQVLDWDPDYDPANGPDSGLALGGVQARVLVSAISGGGDPLMPASVSCSTSADCAAAFGEAGAACSGGMCRLGWTTANRPDSYRHEEECQQIDVPTMLVDFSNGDPLYAAVRSIVDLPGVLYCSLRDPHEPVFFGALALDVPPGASGVYNINLSEAFGFENDLTPIPPLAIEGGVLRIVPCAADADCDDLDPCTVDSCESGVCARIPKDGWNPQTQCCNPANGAVVNRSSFFPCIDPVCSLGYGRGTLQMIPRPAGAACSTNDTCTTGQTCTADHKCVGFEHTGPECRKSRYISLAPADLGGPYAIRITLTSLHHPHPPYPPSANNPDMTAFEGEYRWVGPASVCVDSPNLGTTFQCARLQCQPHYADWAEQLNGEFLHVTGSAVAPSSIYDMAQLPIACMGAELNCPEIVGGPTVETGRWMDVAAAYQNSTDPSQSQPNVIDLGYMLEALRDVPSRISKPRVHVQGEDLDPAADLTVIEIGRVVDSIKGLGYPFAGPLPCDP